MGKIRKIIFYDKFAFFEAYAVCLELTHCGESIFTEINEKFEKKILAPTLRKISSCDVENTEK